VYSLPGGVIDRGFICGASTGRICSNLADGGGAAPAGPVGGLTATADSPQANATMWTIILPQAA
jgi:hypothetical protein